MHIVDTETRYAIHDLLCGFFLAFDQRGRSPFRGTRLRDAAGLLRPAP